MTHKFIPYLATDMPAVGDVVCMIADIENLATSNFSTAIIGAVRPHPIHGGVVVTLHRAHMCVNFVGGVFTAVEIYYVDLELFRKRFLGHSDGSKLSNRKM